MLNNLLLNKTYHDIRENTTYLCELPQDPCSRHELLDDLGDAGLEARVAKVAHADDSKDLVDRVVGGQRAVEGVEVALEALGDVVAATARLDHCADELYSINAKCEGKLMLLYHAYGTQGGKAINW